MTLKYNDWRSWLAGLRSCVMRAGATAITTQLTAWFGSNAISTLPISWVKDIGLSWKTAIITLVAQFFFHCLFAAASYIQNNPDPPQITETVDTTHISRDPQTGQVTEAGTSKTVTTTPVQPTDKQP